MRPRDFTRLTQENKKWLYKELTEKIIGAAMEVHRILGPGNKSYLWIDRQG